MRCDAVLARAENGMTAIVSPKRGATGSRLSLVAGRRSVAEVRAPRALQQIARHGCHVSYLPRRREKQRLAEHRVPFLHARLPRDVAHTRERTEAQPAVWQIAHRCEARVAVAERVEIDEMLGSLDLELHEVHERRTAGDE